MTVENGKKNIHMNYDQQLPLDLGPVISGMGMSDNSNSRTPFNINTFGPTTNYGVKSYHKMKVPTLVITRSKPLNRCSYYINVAAPRSCSVQT